MNFCLLFRGWGFALNCFPARWGFHCISLTVKVDSPGIPQLEEGKGVKWGWGFRMIGAQPDMAKQTFAIQLQ